MLKNAKIIQGPAYEEMLHPKGIAVNNLYRINWQCTILEIPREITGLEARILVLLGYYFPSGSHKVGATYYILMEKEKEGKIYPGITKIIGPSTGNFGIGTAWSAFQKGYQGIVVMPDGMSIERSQRIKQYGSEIIYTPGTESDVILTIEKAKELGKKENHFVLAQFEDFANYRFHYYVTGGSILEKIKGKISAFVCAPGSAGTIAAGDRIKEIYPDALNVAAEPAQCSTLYNGGIGQHKIEGIGDKMAPLILNINNLDRVVTVDDKFCIDLLYYFVKCRNYYYEFGISGMCNLIAAVKIAKFENFKKDDIIVTIATDGLDRYYSYINEINFRTKEEAEISCDNLKSISPEGILKIDNNEKERLYALKENTWLKWYSKEYLNQLKDEDFWKEEREKVKLYNIM
ncbi:MAG: pyridoxal-phosphate dependent enzyme [Armatimonadetes bacterium]|nr:pyridoxal-phosphate dependent enzyme [Armatimonadota bacterium]